MSFYRNQTNYTLVHLKFGSDVNAFLRAWRQPAFVRVRVLFVRLSFRARFVTAIKEIRTYATTELEVNQGISPDVICHIIILCLIISTQCS